MAYRYSINVISTKVTDENGEQISLWKRFCRRTGSDNGASRRNSILKQYRAVNAAGDYFVFETEEDYLAFKLAWLL